MTRKTIPLPQVQCVHWTPGTLNGTCGLGLYGGKPSVGLCKQCENCQGVLGEPPPPHAPAAPDALITPERRAQLETYKEACRTCPFWLGEFEKVKGTDLDGYTKCSRCNCVSKRVSLLTGYCLEDRW